MAPLLLILPLAYALWPDARPTEKIVLLPSADGRPSALVITSKRGETLVDRPYLAASVYQSGAVKPQDEPAAEVRTRYGSTLAALPEAAATYTLYFDAASDRLTPESAARLAQIRDLLARRSQPEIAIVGHADRGDAPGQNEELSLQRAHTVLRELTGAGIAGERIAVLARGTRQSTGEPGNGANRRVDIRVR